MKAHKSLFFIITALLLSALASCSVSVSSSAHADERAYLSLSVNEMSSRTILPNDISEDDITYVSLIITDGETTIDGRTWWRDEGNNKTALDSMHEDDNIYLTPGTYTFTLELYTDTEGRGSWLSQRAILEDKTVVSGENVLTFNTEYVTDSNGILSLFVTWSEDDRISGVQAGLFTAESDGETEVEGYELSGIYSYQSDDGTIIGEYERWIAPGEYFVRFDIYAWTDNGDEKINSIEEVVRILPGCVTEATIPLENINTLYTVTYNLNEGWWTDGFEPVTYRNAQKILTLPTATDIQRDDYQFDGWFESDDDGETLKGEAVTRIGAGTQYDIELWAKWTKLIAYGTIEVTLPEYSDIDITVEADGAPLTENGIHTVEKGVILTFTAGDYESYYSCVDEPTSFTDGVSVNEKGNVLTIDTSKLSAGSYDIVIEVTDSEGTWYSYWAQVKVKD